jgi:hypothetical protein
MSTSIQVRDVILTEEELKDAHDKINMYLILLVTLGNYIYICNIFFNDINYLVLIFIFILTLLRYYCNNSINNNYIMLS